MRVRVGEGLKKEGKKKGAHLTIYHRSKTADMEAKEAKMANTCVLSVKRLTEYASLPTRGSAHAAGYDLYRCVVCGRRQMLHFLFDSCSML